MNRVGVKANLGDDNDKKNVQRASNIAGRHLRKHFTPQEEPETWLHASNGPPSRLPSHGLSTRNRTAAWACLISGFLLWL